MAGTFSERARMAVWYVRLPASTAKPWMRVQSSCAASEAVSSSAIRIELAQVLVLDAGEHRPELFVGTVHGPGGVDPLLLDDLFRPADKQRIVEHQDLRVEDRRQLAAASLQQTIANILQLLL
jgi:hypothetical protein